MLLLEPIKLFKNILKRYPNSYLCEDKEQIIIGIDCVYIDGLKRDFSDLKAEFNALVLGSQDMPSFAGLFGVLSWDFTRFFEDIAKAAKAPYDFPPYLFANAKAYLHYEKRSKIYSFYGDSSYQKEYENIPDGPGDESKEYSFSYISSEQKESEHFLDMVQKAKEYLASGDVFQVVLASQLCLKTNLDTLKFYQELCKANPSPYMFYFPTPYGIVVGSSPELVFSKVGDELFIAPIAGTAPRGADLNEDERIKQALLSDEKELAEHAMLIDLARNDLGRVCAAKSVSVKNAMNVKFFQKVMHIESEVYAKLASGLDAFDALASIFPAGTLSGTPKIRAMQIISELEASGRGIYGGGIGFLRFNGDALIAILIRSAIFVKDRVFIGAGAGIVFDSKPQKELEEIRHKRASLESIFTRLCKRLER